MVSNAVSDEPEEPQPPFHIRERVQPEAQTDTLHDRRRVDGNSKARATPPRPVFRIGGSPIQVESTSSVPQNEQSSESLPAIGEMDTEAQEPNGKEHAV